MEPPERQQKMSESQNINEEVETSIDSELPDKNMKSYFEAIKTSSKVMFKCLLCGKQLCGNFSNYKDHLWSSHNTLALQFGVEPPKKKQKKEGNVMIKEEREESPNDFEQATETSEDDINLKSKHKTSSDVSQDKATKNTPSEEDFERLGKTYYKKIASSSKPMFRCLICTKELCGNFSNFKDHLWSCHTDMIREMGFSPPEKKKKSKKRDSIKQENDDSSEDEMLPSIQDQNSSSLRSYFEAIKTGTKVMFKCLMCTKILCGTYANYRQHIWSSHNKEALDFGMEPPTSKQRARDSNYEKPRRREFNLFESIDYDDSLTEDDKSCRLCNDKDQRLMSIFQRKKGQLISTMVAQIIPEVSIDRSDGFSQEICTTCIDIIASACDLKKRSIENDKKLRGEADEPYFEDESFEYYNPLEFRVKEEPIDIPAVQGPSKSSPFKMSETFHVKEEFVDVSASHMVSVSMQEETCDSTMPSRHISNAHGCSNHSPLKCDICEINGLFRTFKSKSKLEEHMVACHVHSSGNSFASETSEWEKNLRLYYEPNRSTTRRLFRCLMCERELCGTFTNFKSHMWSVHNQAARTFGMEEPKKKGRNDGEDSMKMENEESQNLGEIDGETSLRTYYEAIKSSSKRMFKCLMCGKNLCGAFTNFRQHLWSSHNKEAKQFGMVAPTAKQKFASLKNKGSSAGNSSEEYECEHCHRFYKTFYACHMHKKRDHVEIMFPFTCPHCAKRFETKEKIDDHIFVQHENLKCKICLLQFESRPAYNLHNFVHCNYVEEYMDPDQKYACSLCAFQCDDDEFLQGHLVTHANDFFEKSYLVCIWCSQTFKDFEELVNHTNDHNLRITHRCLRCFKTFPYGDRLLRHLKRYQDSYTCDYCGHCESGKARLEEHIKVKHMQEICFLCPFCGESKSSEHALKNHIKTRHEVEKKFKCDQCPKAFSNASFYRNHQSVHTNVKSFACQSCAKTFKSLRNLKRHQLFHEPSKIKYKHLCDYDNCGKRFYTNYAKTRHMLTHSGIRPWVCDFEGCDRSFSQSQDLNKHRRIHVGSECTYTCDYQGCSMAFKYVQDLRLHLGVHYQQK